jgi:hypothetical protein
VEKLIKEVLDKYNTKRKKITNIELARLIGKKGWFLNLNSLDGKYKLAEEFIEEFGG